MLSFTDAAVSVRACTSWGALSLFFTTVAAPAFFVVQVRYSGISLALHWWSRRIIHVLGTSLGRKAVRKLNSEERTGRFLMTLKRTGNGRWMSVCLPPLRGWAAGLLGRADRVPESRKIA